MPDTTVAEVRLAFQEADTFATEVAEYRQDVVIPAQNQLRNAGYHLVKAFTDEGVVGDAAQLYDALDHCRRAKYDAAVAGIVSARDYIGAFRRQFRGLVIKEVVPDYADILVREKKARDLVGAGRYDAKSDGERIAEYMDTFRALRADTDRLSASEDDLNAKKRLQESSQFWSKTKGVAVIASATAVIVTLLIRILERSGF